MVGKQKKLNIYSNSCSIGVKFDIKTHEGSSEVMQTIHWTPSKRKGGKLAKNWPKLAKKRNKYIKTQAMLIQFG